MSSFGGSFAVLAAPAAQSKSFGGLFALRAAQPPGVFTQSIGGSFQVLSKVIFTQSIGGSFMLGHGSPVVIKWLDGEWLALSENRWQSGGW